MSAPRRAIAHEATDCRDSILDHVFVLPTGFNLSLPPGQSDRIDRGGGALFGIATAASRCSSTFARQSQAYPHSVRIALARLCASVPDIGGPLAPFAISRSTKQKRRQSSKQALIRLSAVPVCTRASLFWHLWRLLSWSASPPLEACYLCHALGLGSSNLGHTSIDCCVPLVNARWRISPVCCGRVTGRELQA